MPKFLEDKLRREAEAKGKKGKALDAYVYGTMNNMGAMHGSAETAKGKAMDKQHEEDMRKKRAEMMLGKGAKVAPKH